MEAGLSQSSKASGWGLALALALVLLIRIPFWTQAVQGDDDTYLAEATHALVDPLHPSHTKYVFLGEEWDLRGHPHPPLDAWVLAGLIAVVGGVKEVPFHAAYTVFSLIAAAAMWSLSKRFSSRPLWATLLFLAVPAFVVNGNSFETDLPFLAFWMAAMAGFVGGRMVLAVPAMALAALTSPQCVFLTPILAVYVWLYRRRDWAAWAATLVAPVTFGVWQVFERVSTGAVPAEVLAKYLEHFDFWNPAARVALAIHAWFLIFPVLTAAALVLAWRKRRESDTLFLMAWIGIFFACALVVFFAGSARYLLPMAAPLALLASRLPAKWLAAGFVFQLALGLGMAVVNYQHWDGYRSLAERLQPITREQRVWVNGEWGLRHYLESNGALPLTKSQHLRAGDVVVSSDLGSSVSLTAPVSLITKVTIQPAIPLRLIGLESHSGYSTASRGVWPFGISDGPIDRVRAEKIVERRATLEYLTMNDAAAADHLVSGIYSLEDNRYRWMGRSAVVALKSPASALPLRVMLEIPQNAPARHVALLLDGREVASQTYQGPGAYTLESPPMRASGATATVEIDVDRTFTAPPDTRELGIVLTAAGFAAR